MDNLSLKQRKLILQLKFPACDPAVAQYDYMESKLLTSAPKIFPSWDKCRNSVDVDSYDLKRIKKEAEYALKVTKRDAEIKYALNDERWEELETKELELRKSFMKFQDFVQTNEDKRSRALKKIAEEKEMQEKRAQMIIDTEEMCACLSKTKAQFEAKIRDYRIYEDFLVRVLGHSGGIVGTVNDIIKRYAALMEAKEVIQQKRSNEMDDLDNAKGNLLHLIEDKSQKLIEMNSELVDLISRHDHAKGLALHWENIVSAIKIMILQKINEVDGVKLSTWNMYEQMCARKHQPPLVKKTDFEEQLIYIKNTLRELNGVYTKVEKQIAAGNKKKIRQF